ncbi:amino acid/polyamine/organocation transporter, APC superfamily [Chryseobacterium soldanellicola]|uniref:Amino acid/polyamine/organocation transporter, APC superfamily n=1 Tax=Chryseobacterium soldanellicola TaxID=311333 RepID=A0A1H1F9H1_9FLAO|nr:APC family permease [Chryseobacterium soldanellicola]SDQ97498.1 amino acid/polyamine/organocation transporter, APC superfamily [Chryseobacterium soldanellicola]
MSTKKLSEWYATAICGNDITSSCLYVSALAIVAAGQYAWVALLMVAAVLFLFRKIYGEVVGALPLNGGAYNVLLNTTTKSNASIAACLTILSYMATAVISSSEAMHYLHHILPYFNVNIATFVLLLIFLGLTILGISESAVVALAIFVFHLATMAVLIGSCFFFVWQHGFSILIDNFHLPARNGSILTAIFFGFSAAMLGISGFESSSNFVEEQERGVFTKTLRNMWIAVSVLNPLIAFLVICIIPISSVEAHQNSFLSYIGTLTGGKWLAMIISINAVSVLSGAVLTSFVGVNGLIKRMTLDRILPNYFLKENKRGSTYRILILFFLLCLSVLLVTRGQLAPLAAVYALSFLTVMASFALGNILLKLRRSRLPRPEYARPGIVLIAFAAIIIALYGNIMTKPQYLVTFLQYFIPSVLIILAMLLRKDIMHFIVNLMQSLSKNYKKYTLTRQRSLYRSLKKLYEQDFVFFSKGDDIATLNKVMMYLHENEVTNKMKIVTVLHEAQQPDPKFLADFDTLDRAYPEVDMEYITLLGDFTPQLVEELSNKWGIPKNFMFISSPGEKFSYRVDELGGVRLIL